MAALRICIISILFTAIYLLTSVLITNIFFYNKSNGSLIKVNDKIVGSSLIGQNFTNSKYFHGRPSLNQYKNNISGNSELPFHSNLLINKVRENNKNFLARNKNSKPDLNIITESGSGLDPHITYNGALSQVDRISSARNISKDLILNIINKKSKPRILGLFGERIVNILELNLELDNHDKTIRSR